MKLPSRSAGDEQGDNGVLQVQGVDQEGVFFCENVRHLARFYHWKNETANHCRGRDTRF